MHAVPTRMCKSRSLGEAVEHLLYTDQKEAVKLDISAGKFCCSDLLSTVQSLGCLIYHVAIGKYVRLPAPFPPSHYCLTSAELETLEFPKAQSEGIVSVPSTVKSLSAGALGDSNSLIALDCEMVLTTSGQRELARITVINQQFDTLYDTYVLPSNPVVDYLTQWSGITPDLLRGVTTTLEDVQRRMLELLSPTTILVSKMPCMQIGKRVHVHHELIESDWTLIGE